MENTESDIDLPKEKIRLDESEIQILPVQSGSQPNEQPTIKEFRHPVSSLSSYENNRQQIRTRIMAIALFIGFLTILFISGNYSLQKQPLQMSKVHTKLPKILWIYTYHNWQGQTAMNRIHFHYFNHTAVQNGYEVRIVDSWTAYDWLSQQTIANITKTIQNTDLDETVCSLLKLALLIEHGGILISDLQFLWVNNDFQWIEKMFEKDGNSSLYSIDPNIAEVYTPIRPILTPTFNSQYLFSPIFIASVPHSIFLLESFHLLQRTIVEHYLPHNDIYGFLRRNDQVGIDYLPHSIASVMTSLVAEANKKYQLVCDVHRHYKIQSPKKWNYIDFDRINNEDGQDMLWTDNKTVFEGVDFVMNTYNRVREVVDTFLENPPYEIEDKNTLIYQLLSVPQNQKIFFKPLPKRQEQLCIIWVDELQTEGQLKTAINAIKDQSYKNWKMIVFSGIFLKPNQLSDKVVVVPKSGNEVRRIQIAVTQHCKPQTYTLLLKQGDKFQKNNALQAIANALKPREILGASIGLKIHDKKYDTNPDYLTFSKERDSIKDPNYNKMNGILNHMRIFSVDAFRYIPQLEWRDTYGVYFEDRTIILTTLLELLAQRQKIRHPDHQHKYYYIKRYYGNVFHFPTKAIQINSGIRIITDKYEEVSKDQIVRTKHRYDIEPIELSMINCQLWGVPFSKMLVFNKGAEFVPINQKKGPELIPKVIHQAWLGGEIPYAKRYFLQKTKRMHPNYKFKVWNEQDITPQTFPVSHDIIQTLLTYQKSGKSVYKKYATIVDLMRHELMYQHGGFWRDAGLNLFKPVFDHFTRYKLVIGGQVTVGSRWDQGMCFFGNERKSENMLRVSNYRNVNRMRFYHHWAVTIAGPIDFRQVVIGDEESSPDILVMHFQYFYPAQVGHPYPDLCVKKKQEVGERQKYEFQYNGYVLLPSECEKNYPIAFGVDHNNFGVSWE